MTYNTFHHHTLNFLIGLFVLTFHSFVSLQAVGESFNIDGININDIDFTKDVTVKFKETAQGLKVKIETPRFIIRTIKPKDLDNYIDLFCDAETVQKYATGNPYTPEQVADRIKGWVKKWENGDPFAGMAVFLKEEIPTALGSLPKGIKHFVGHVVLGHGDEPGHSEFAMIIRKPFWNAKHAAKAAEENTGANLIDADPGQTTVKPGAAGLTYVGTEAVGAMVVSYANELVRRHFELDGAPFSIINVTARIDNIGSQKIFEYFHFKEIGQNEKFGAMRKVFALEVASPRIIDPSVISTIKQPAAPAA